jgi:hypothetical protein
MASPCVAVGDRQAITITAPPGASVAYQAVYADGKGGLSPGYYGGNKGGVAGADGTFHDQWVVGPGAPAGPVAVTVVAVSGGQRASTSTSFAVAGGTGCQGGAS